MKRNHYPTFHCSLALSFLHFFLFFFLINSVYYVIQSSGKLSPKNLTSDAIYSKPRFQHTRQSIDEKGSTLFFFPSQSISSILIDRYGLRLIPCLSCLWRSSPSSFYLWIGRVYGKHFTRMGYQIVHFGFSLRLWSEDPVHKKKNNPFPRTLSSRILPFFGWNLLYYYYYIIERLPLFGLLISVSYKYYYVKWDRMEQNGIQYSVGRFSLFDSIIIGWIDNESRLEIPNAIVINVHLFIHLKFFNTNF